MKLLFMGYVLMGAAALAMAAGPVRAEEGMTFAALQIAYGRELNSRADYLAFADQADREGHVAAACVFRAVAFAESVHAARQAVVIEQMGGQPVWHREATEVGETAQNLSRAMENEHREYSAVYPQFARYARAECLYAALAVMNYACAAERTHERAFAHALARVYKAREVAPPVTACLVVAAYGEPDTPATAAGETCYVCSGDGSVWPRPMKHCPNCGAGGAGFARFSCPGAH
jgi:rubrerythrin